jgi:hypothetical protein
MIKHQLPVRYPIPDNFTQGEAEYSILDRMGNVALYRRRVNKSVSYVVAVGNAEGRVPSVKGSPVRALSSALEVMDAAYAASIGNPLYRVESI